MDKMKFETPDMAQMNVEKIAALFPNCVTESKGADGKLKKAVNFDALKQMLGSDVAEGDESYEFTWVGKRDAMVEAAKPIRKTLRPCVEESVNFDTTENLYIEGDNLEALKLLQEGYLGKVKMIYIDPPYNTGNDFIYKDDFRMDSDKYAEESGAVDDEGNRMVQNSDSNGRFHSDWCSMIYSRLLLARNLLTDDGVIFISIDDNEQANLKKICDEVFGNSNELGTIANINNPKGRSDDKYIATAHETLLVYARNADIVKWYGFEPTDEIIKRYNKSEADGRKYREIDLRKTGENDLREDRPNLFYYFYFNETTGDFYPSREKKNVEGYIRIFPQREDGKEGNWRWGIETAERQKQELIPKFMPSRKVWGVMQKDFLEGRDFVKPTSSWTFKDVNSERGTEEFINLGFDKRIFPKPKPLGTIDRCLRLAARMGDELVLDFFSGSATTAHAVMQLNAEDGGNRKFIMVQLPEKCDESSEAAKAGYKTICEIGKERIRRAGAKVLADQQVKQKSAEGKNDLFDSAEQQPTAKNLDVGFRVLKIDESNMKDVYYSAGEITQQDLVEQISNIKDGRTDLDLLFGCLVDWGVSLSLPIKIETIEGVKVHNVNDGDLVACFSEQIPETAIRQIAAAKPLRAVFRDSSFASDSAKINVTEIFKTISPNTTVKVV